MDPKRCFKDSNLGHAAYACSLTVNTCTPDTGTEYQVWPDTGYTYGLAEYPVRQDS